MEIVISFLRDADFKKIIRVTHCKYQIPVLQNLYCVETSDTNCLQNAYNFAICSKLSQLKSNEIHSEK